MFRSAFVTGILTTLVARRAIEIECANAISQMCLSTFPTGGATTRILGRTVSSGSAEFIQVLGFGCNTGAFFAILRSRALVSIGATTRKISGHVGIGACVLATCGSVLGALRIAAARLAKSSAITTAANWTPISSCDYFVASFDACGNGTAAYRPHSGIVSTLETFIIHASHAITIFALLNNAR